MDIRKFELLLDEIAVKIPALSIAVGTGTDIPCCEYRGQILENAQVINNKSRFDIASLTKIFTGISFMKMCEEGFFCLDEPVCKYFSELNRKYPIEKAGVIIGEADARKITWVNVLSHTTGMGWTREKTRPSLPHVHETLNDIFELPFAYETGKKVVYSDLPIILMGKAMEKVAERPLDKIVEDYVIGPLGLSETGYNRGNTTKDRDNFVPTEYDDVFRKQRIWGAVHDENAFLLDGVAAHAGIFSTVLDLCKLGIALNEALRDGGLLKKETMKMMIKEHFSDGEDRRGLIWQLSNVSGNTNAYTSVLSSSAYGHAGFTGCFMWMDPISDMTVVFLSNDIYNGRNYRKLFEYRLRILQAVNEIYGSSGK